MNLHSSDDILDLPHNFSLYQNHPNPFNPITTLRYDIPQVINVNIAIYDMMGRQVKTLVNGIQSAGHKSVQWNSTNNQGKPVSAGVYLYKIQVGDFVDTKKMILLR
jgi:flagellar hook assembly protein FlgD